MTDQAEALHHPNEQTDETANTERAIELTPSDADRIKSLGALAVELVDQYDITGETADLEKAIETVREGICSEPESLSEKAFFFLLLGRFIHRRYQKTGHIGDRDEAILELRKASSFTHDDNSLTLAILDSLENNVMHRFNETKKVADLEEMTNVARNRLRLTPDDDPDRGRLMCKLANYLADQSSQTTGQDTYIENLHETDITIKRDRLVEAAKHGFINEAIKLQKEVIHLTPKDSPNRPIELDSLGIYYLNRYHKTHDLADLNESIEAHREAVCQAPDDDPCRGIMMARLSQAIRCRYDHINRLTNSEEAIKRTDLEEANLMAELEEAIEIAKEALHLAAKDDPIVPKRLINVATCLESRYEKTNNLADLEEALEMSRKAFSIASGKPDQGFYAMALIEALRLQFKRTGNMATLEESIEMGRNTVQQESTCIVIWMVSRQVLAGLLHVRYAITGEITDLDECIKMLRDSRQRIAEPNWHWVGLTQALVKMLEERQKKKTGSEADKLEITNLRYELVQMKDDDAQ